MMHTQKEPSRLCTLSKIIRIFAVEQRKLAEMGWHCITVWECELKPSRREDTLESLAFTLNHIWLQDHGAKTIPYPKLEEEDMQMPMAAEDVSRNE